MTCLGVSPKSMFSDKGKVKICKFPAFTSDAKSTYSYHLTDKLNPEKSFDKSLISLPRTLTLFSLPLISYTAHSGPKSDVPSLQMSTTIYNIQNFGQYGYDVMNKFTIWVREEHVHRQTRQSFSAELAENNAAWNCLMTSTINVTIGIVCRPENLLVQSAFLRIEFDGHFPLTSARRIDNGTKDLRQKGKFQSFWVS
ncbi:unnamed protein product [Clavelina lepadiformis]|uniref:Uncharacterized protein n=1 Tax=Clavelina lepadiformis TaxID=159417 RepID=A0ABP0FKY4_CLALP